MKIAAGRIDSATIEQAKRVDLRNFCEQRFGPMEKNAHHDWQGKCPKCGTNYFHVYQKGAEWRFRCYECHDTPGDGIELVRWLQPGLSFNDAVTELLGKSWHGPAPVPATPQRTPAPQRPPDWLRRATLTLQNAQARLLEPEGEPGQEYLLHRMLEPRTWLHFGLGYRPDANVPGTQGQQKAPAIVIPWYAGGQLIGLRYRFLEEQNGNRLSTEFGSEFKGRLFGGQGLPDWVRLGDSDGKFESMCFLAIFEGEINCMSAWQVAGHTNLHTLSLGSESANLPNAMVPVAQRYRGVIFSVDSADVARKLQAALPGACSLTSPGGKDANDLLKEGLLGAVLAMARWRACRNEHEREGLLWDLYDAARSWVGVDAGTIQVIEELASDLGKTIQPLEVGANYA